MRFFSQRAGSDVGVSAKLSPLPCFPQDNHKDPFGFKGLLLITSERKQPKNKKTKKKLKKLTVTINTGKLQILRNPSKFLQHWSLGYSYGSP